MKTSTPIKLFFVAATSFTAAFTCNSVLAQAPSQPRGGQGEAVLAAKDAKVLAQVRIPVNHANIHSGPSTGNEVIVLAPKGAELPMVAGSFVGETEPPGDRERELLPADTISHSFDNVADSQAFSTTLMESYLRAAAKITALAIGDKDAPAAETNYRVPKTASQMSRVEGAPFGTRGGIAVMVTHRPSALNVVDKVALVMDGRIKLFGPRDEVMRKINEGNPQAGRPARPPVRGRAPASSRRQNPRRPSRWQRGWQAGRTKGRNP